jgi:putative ABC transport system permease protein
VTLELLIEALRSLMRHKLRSLLTALGIIFGVASVMSMVATGEGARRQILAQIQELGVRNVIINSKKPPAERDVSQSKQDRVGYGLTFVDADRIASSLPHVARVLRVHDVEKWIWFKSRRLEAKVRGVAPEYMETLNLRPVLGRSLTRGDGIEQRRVCVVRERLLREAKYLGDPLALDLRIGVQYFRVVGVLPDLALQSANQSVLGIDDRALEVYVPFETVVGRYGLETASLASEEVVRVELHQIVCEVADESAVTAVARGVQALLQHAHPRKDYEVTVPLELLASRQQTQRVFDVVLPIIAGISLLVGGIGILNIMLASVTERTREIGIRRAIGASRGDIVLQFLIETVTLAAAAGILGALLGFGFVLALQRLTEWQPIVTGWAVTLALLISCLTGIAFGIYPARRAALMDPIRALRHE